VVITYLGKCLLVYVLVSLFSHMVYYKGESLVGYRNKYLSILCPTLNTDVVNHSVYCIFYTQKGAEKVALFICVKIILGDNYERNIVTN
jgi:hypothetical protein